jgi:hypothetical protein
MKNSFQNTKIKLFIFFICAIFIVIAGKFLGDILLGHFAEITVTIANSPILKTSLYIMITVITIQSLWKPFRKK